MASSRALSDADLMQALSRAKPSTVPSGPLTWGDVPGQALQNIPASAGQFAQNLLFPFLHPIQTAETFYDIGRGLLSKAGIAESEESEATVEAIGQFFVDRYGSMENLKKTLATDPVGIAADAATVLTGGAALGARAPGMVGQVARATGTAARAIDPVSVLGKAAKVAGKAASYPLGLTTGAGPRAIQEAGKAGMAGNKVFASHMRGAGDINEPIAMAKRGTAKLAAARGRAYERGMTGIRNDPTHLDVMPVGAALRKAANKISPHGVPKSRAAADTLQAIADKLDEFAHLQPTIAVMDDIKQAIGEIRQKTEFGTLERSIADDIYNATKDTITKQAPQYASVMKGYSEASDNLTQMSKTLSLGEKATKDTALRKLQSTMRNNVNTNYGARTKLGDQLSRLEPDLMPAIAGQALSSPTPRGIQGALAGAGTVGAASAAAAGMLDPTYLTALALASPRLVGETAYLAGRVGSKAAVPVRGLQQAGRVAKELTAPARAAGASVTPIPPLDNLPDDELMRLLNRR